jgi:hypothetical protein
MIFCVLAAVGPSRAVFAKIGARAAAKRMTEFGSFQEIPITWMDWLLGICSLILLVAAAMELVRRPEAAPLALLATIVLWTYFGPGIWAHVRAERFFAPAFFEPIPGRGYAASAPWQQCVFQVGATLFAAYLTYIRYWARSAS